LKSDIHFGGADQKKVFDFASENLPRVGYKKRIHLMCPIIPGLSKAQKMDSSDPSTTIDFDDSNKQIKTKVNTIFSVDGIAEGNALLIILHQILFRFLDKNKKPFIVPRPEKYGGELKYATYADVEAAFIKKDLLSVDLKSGIAERIIDIVSPIRDRIQKKENQALFDKAYKVATGKGAEQTLGINSLEIKVGKILSIERHKDADSLYVEQIDVGEEKPRTVVSGLVKYIPIEKMQNRMLLVCTNLQPAELRGVSSEGMVLAAANKDRSVIDLVNVPEGAKIGEQIKFEGETGDADKPFISKGRLQKIVKFLHTNKDAVPLFKEKQFMTSAGPCTSTIPDATVS